MYLISHLFTGHLSSKVLFEESSNSKNKKYTSVYTSFKDFELLKDNKIVSLYLKRISVRPVFREQAAKNHGPEAFALYPEVLEEVSSINR